MMQQANTEFGFEADNIPLMIEAIPVSADSIILIISKVEDPEELDTRFSKFTPFGGSGNNSSEGSGIELEGADDILDIFRKIYEAKSKAKGSQKKEKKNNGENTILYVSFGTLLEQKAYFLQNYFLIVLYILVTISFFLSNRYFLHVIH